MEQSQMNITSSRKFTDVLSIIYELITTYRNRANTDDKQADKNKSRNLAGIATIAFLILVGALYAALSFLPSETWGRKHRGGQARSAIGGVISLYTGRWYNHVSIFFCQRRL